MSTKKVVSGTHLAHGRRSAGDGGDGDLFPEKAQAFQDLALALLALCVYASLVPSVQPLLVSSVSWEPREGRDPL